MTPSLSLVFIVCVDLFLTAETRTTAVEGKPGGIFALFAPLRFSTRSVILVVAPTRWVPLWFRSA